MLRDAQRRREKGSLLFGPAFSLGPKLAQECSRGAEKFGDALRPPKGGSLLSAALARGSAASSTANALGPPPAGLCLGFVADSYQQPSCSTERPGERTGNENGALRGSSVL